MTRHFWEKHMYVHMSYLPCPSICSEFGPEGISIQLSTVLISPRHVIPWYLSCIFRNVPSWSVVILVVPCYRVFTVTLVGDTVYLWRNLAGFWFKKKKRPRFMSQLSRTLHNSLWRWEGTLHFFKISLLSLGKKNQHKMTRLKVFRKAPTENKEILIPFCSWRFCNQFFY